MSEREYQPLRVHLAVDTNRWGACGRARAGKLTYDPAEVSCLSCRRIAGLTVVPQGDDPTDEAEVRLKVELAAAESAHLEAVRMFHMLCRQMQAAYAAGLRDGPEACMDWLGNALAQPGNLPSVGADPQWYAEDAWTEGPPWPTPPMANATINEPGGEENHGE